MLSDIVVALPEQAATLAATQNHAAIWQTLQAKNVDHVKLATLMFLLKGLPPDDGPVIEYMKRFKELGTPRVNGPVILQVPADLTALLAELESTKLTPISAAWARSEEAVRDRWSAQDTEQLLVHLSILARSARSQKKSLLLWLAP